MISLNIYVFRAYIGSEIISVVVYILKIYIYFVVSDAICRLSTFILDSRLFYSRLSTFLLSTLDFFTLHSQLFSLDSRLLLSTLDFYSRLSTITLDSRPSTFGYTRRGGGIAFAPSPPKDIDVKENTALFSKLEGFLWPF